MRRNVPFILLMVVGVMEFLFITCECLFSSIGTYVIKTYLVIPCLLFAGFAIGTDLSTASKRRMLVAWIMTAWFLVVQMQRRITGEERQPMDTILLVYLMALPYAEVAKDRMGINMKCLGKLFVAASMVLVGYLALLLLDMLPSEFADVVFLDGARANVLRHPNVTACYFMIGIGFTAYLWCQTEKKTIKALMVFLAVVQFVAMALTNSRTIILLTCAFFCGIVFFKLEKRNWVQLLAALLVAVAVLVGMFWTSGKIYAFHNDMLREKISAHLELNQEEPLPQPELESEETVASVEQEQEEPIEQKQEEATLNLNYREENGEVVLITQSGQNTLAVDMWTLNGRTSIWKSALQALRDGPSFPLWGTAYVGTVISAYNYFPVAHAHNAWIETLMRLGVPGLLFALVFTVMAVRDIIVILWNERFELWKKVIALLALCLLGAGFLEPYLFITQMEFHVTNFVFFICLGYLEYWRSMRPTVEE